MATQAALSRQVIIHHHCIHQTHTLHIPPHRHTIVTRFRSEHANGYLISKCARKMKIVSRNLPPNARMNAKTFITVTTAPIKNQLLWGNNNQNQLYGKYHHLNILFNEIINKIKLKHFSNFSDLQGLQLDPQRLLKYRFARHGLNLLLLLINQEFVLQAFRQHADQQLLGKT